MNRPAWIEFEHLYLHFDASIATIDCGQMCAPHNPSGKPFCCDICQAVPAAYHAEWEYLKSNTDFWHEWTGDECPEGTENRAELRAETPDSMLLLACQGPANCQRQYRLISCRQFPFFPYITSDLEFIGLAYEWEFEPVCWVISNLQLVSARYRLEFVGFYDELFDRMESEIKGYALKSEEMRDHFLEINRRIPILHRNGGCYLLSPGSERLRRTKTERLPRFGPYQEVENSDGIKEQNQSTHQNPG